MTRKLLMCKQCIRVNRYIKLKLTFPLRPIRFSVHLDGLKLRATSSDILHCVTFVGISQFSANL